MSRVTMEESSVDSFFRRHCLVIAFWRFNSKRADQIPTELTTVFKVAFLQFWHRTNENNIHFFVNCPS